MKLIALYNLKLSKTTPAPPTVYAVKFDGETNQARKLSWAKGYKDMQDSYPKHKSITLVGVFEDKQELVQVGEWALENPKPSGQAWV